jgi:hypothetical protein
MMELGYDGANADITSNILTSQTFDCRDGSGALTVPFTLAVQDTTHFPASGQFTVVDTDGVTRVITYLDKPNGTHFANCIAPNTFKAFTVSSAHAKVQCLGQYGIWSSGSSSYGGLDNAGRYCSFTPITGAFDSSNTCAFNASASANVLTVSSVSSGTLRAGHSITAQNKNCDLLSIFYGEDPDENSNLISNVFDFSTTIVSQQLPLGGGESLGGPGRYNISVNYDTVVSEKMYASNLPFNGPVQVADVTQTVTVSQDVEVRNLQFQSFDIQVSNTAGAPALGFINVPNGFGGRCRIAYHGTTATAFLKCTTSMNGVGRSFTLKSGSTAIVERESAFLTENYVGNSEITTALDGRVFVTSGGFYTFFKSPVGTSPYTDVVAANWAGPFSMSNFDMTTSSITSFNSIDGALSFVAMFSFAYEYDNARQALYAFLTVNPLGSQNMDMYLIISRDNGQTWSDPIVVSTDVTGNKAVGNLSLDKMTGDMHLSWTDGRVDPENAILVQRYYAFIPAATLDGYVNAIPLRNPKYKLPAQQVTPLGGAPGIYGQLVVPQTLTNVTTQAGTPSTFKVPAALSVGGNLSNVLTSNVINALYALLPGGFTP